MKLTVTFLTVALAAQTVSARLKGVKSNKRHLKKSKGGSDGDGNIGCEGVEPKVSDTELFELFELDETNLENAVDPCASRSDSCTTLSEVLELYPSIDVSRCSNPDDCDGECRFHSTGLVCDEDDGPFFHLSPICSDDVVVILPPVIPEDPETPIETPVVPPEVPPVVPPEEPPEDDPEVPRTPQDDEGDNSRMGLQGQSLFAASFRNSIP